MTAAGKYKTYTMTRPPEGWGDLEGIMKATQKDLKYSDKYVADILKHRDGEFGDTPEKLNRVASKFWKTFASKAGAGYSEKKRK
jgi:hypothetical protein